MPVAVGTYWWRDVSNFGDRLGPLLLAHFAGILPVWSAVAHAQLISTGSVLEHLPRGWRGRWIAGSGRLHENSTVHYHGAEVMALRGPLSARGIPGSYALGDPGLLAGELVELPAKTHHLGLFPHWMDTTLVRTPAFLRYQPLLISPYADPLTVIRQIGACRKVVTSSLHGLVVADAFGIPRRFEPSPVFARPSEGGMFKFRDYHASIGMDFEPGVTAVAHRNRVEDIQHDLYDMFADLAGRVKA